MCSSDLSNDGTNACAFLAVKIVDKILTKIGPDGEVFADIAHAAEETIWLLPEKKNEYRDISHGKMYDPVEAYELLLAKKIMQSTYDFSEELPFSDGVEGRQKLLSKLCELGRGNFATIFTSEPWVLTVLTADHS